MKATIKQQGSFLKIMKNYLCILILFGLLYGQNAQAQFFNQDFNISALVGDYAPGTPNIRQFDNITSGTNNAISINTNRLRFARTAALQTASSITRSTNIADKDGTAITTAMSSMMIRFTVVTSTLTGNILTPLAGTLQIGTGFTANTSLEGTPYTSVGIHFGSTNNTFRVSAGATSGASNLTPSTSQRITVALNNSGSSLTYRAPDGTTETVANDKMDVWAWNGIAHTRIHDEIDATNPAQTITDFKFVFNPTANFTLDIDDISIFPLEVFPTNVYTVGSATATFTSLTRNGGGFFEVLNFINNINGANTFNVNSNIANENGANDLKEISGMNIHTTKISTLSTTTLRLEGDIAGTASLPGFVVLNGADRVVFDGEVSGNIRLNLRNTNAGNNASVVALVNGATNNTFNKCLIDGATQGTGTNGGLIRLGTTTTTTGNNNNTFQYCQITSSTVTAGGMAGMGFISNGTVGIPNNNNLVTNCEFFDIFRQGIQTQYVFNINDNTTNFTLTASHFYQTITYTASTTSVRPRLLTILGSNNNNINITNNFWGGRSVNCGGSAFIFSAGSAGGQDNVLFAMRINASNSCNMTITGNTIQNISLDFYKTGNCNQSGFWGIWLQAGIADISNNLIGSLTTNDSILCTQKATLSACTAASSAITVYGIQCDASGTGKIENNNIGGITCNVEFTPTGTATVNVFEVAGIRVTANAINCSITSNTIGGTNANNILIQHTLSSTPSSSNSLMGIQTLSTNIAIISNNTIRNLTSNTTGIAGNGAVYGINQTSTANNTIQNNTIYNITCTAQQANVSDNVTVAGIRINAATTSAFTLRGNTIHTIQSTATTSTTSAGILLTGDVNGHIRDNRIYNIRNTSASAQPVATGIVIRSIGNALYLYNNRISLGLETNGTANTESAIYTGIWNNLNDTDNLFASFNSIHIGGQASSGSLKTYAFLQGDNPSATLDATLVNTPLQVYNNIFQNARTGGGDNIAIAVQDATPFATTPCGGGNAPDYNVFFATDETKTGEWAGIPYGFTAWKTNSGADINSYSANTGGATAIAFTTPETADLHLNANDQRPDGKAMPISTALGFPLTIDFDVDNEFRRSTDAGADEYEQTVTFIQVNDNWHDVQNWQVQGSTPPRYAVPNCADNVVIPIGKTVRVYNGGAENPTNVPAFFYTLTIQNGGTVELKDGTNTYSCWYNDELTVGQVHKGEIKIETGGTLIANGSNIYASGRFSNSGTFQKGTNIVYLNHDVPNSGNSCLDSYINAYNSINLVSNIDGTSNTNFHHLTISNNGQTTILNNFATDKQIRIGDATTDLGNLNITGTGWVAINDNRLILEGDLTENTGSIAGSPTSDLIFYGTGNLTGTVKLRGNANDYNTFENLRINRPTKGRVIFDTQNGVNTVIVNHQLDLTNGVFQTGATPLTDIILHVINTAISPTTDAVINYATSGGSGANSWVYGRLRRNIDGSTVANAYGFPVGSPTALQLIRVDVNEAFDVSTTYITGYFDSSSPVPAPATLAQPNPNLVEAGNSYDAVCPTGFWNLTPNTFPTGKYDIEMYPVGFACTGSRPTLAKRPDGGGDWTFENSAYVSATKRTGFTAFSDFAPIHVSVPLPLTLLSFLGEAQKSVALLHWQTVGELNTSHFEIERSQDALNFQSIGKKDAKGNFAGISNYTFMDENPQTGTNYYRLKQIDLDGRFTYSPIVALHFEGRQDMSLFPNPNNGQFTIKLPENNGTLLKVQITEATGRVLSIENLAYPAEKGLELKKNLPKGLYFVVINAQNKSYRQKIVIL
jgi:hypothetical protein